MFLQSFLAPQQFLVHNIVLIISSQRDPSSWYTDFKIGQKRAKHWHDCHSVSANILSLSSLRVCSGRENVGSLHP